MATMNSVMGKATSMALAFLCLLLLAMTGDCQAAIEGQTAGNGSEQAHVSAENPLAVNDDTLDEAIKTYPYLVLDCWETGRPPCKLIDPKSG